MMNTSVATEFLMEALIERRVHSYYWDDDFSCAITTLKILSEVFPCELHSQVMEATYGLNAGRLASQCGLVEGVLLFLGVYGRQKGLDSQEIGDLCRNFSSAFQNEFGSVLCKELRVQGFSPDNPPHLCEEITKQATKFSVKFIAKHLHNIQ